MPMKPRRTGNRSALSGTLSQAEAARRLGITVAALRQLLGRQAMDFVEIRGKIRIPEDQLKRYQAEPHP